MSRTLCCPAGPLPWPLRLAVVLLHTQQVDGHLAGGHQQQWVPHVATVCCCSFMCMGHLGELAAVPVSVALLAQRVRWRAWLAWHAITAQRVK